MTFEHSATIPAQRDAVWAFLMDVPRVSQCVPGIEDVKPLDDGTYEGLLKVRVGPISLSLTGTITMGDVDDQAGTATMIAEAVDRKVGGSVSSKMHLRVTAVEADTARLDISTSASVMGKIGEFGQPLIRKKAEQMMTEFTDNVRREFQAA